MAATPTDQLALDALCVLCEGQDVPDELKPQARAMLGDLLIERSLPAPEAVLLAVDEVLISESRGKKAALAPTQEAMPDAMWLSVGATKLAVWRGDIRRLAVGAVVNAANDRGLGCFQPSHRCIDNVLHRAAGPRLREECRVRMARRGPLVAGSAPMLTSGYHLPAAHVLHVTGPSLQPRGRQPTAEEERQLVACYTGCLDAAVAAGIRSVAFCCISTGLFGYPADAAAAAALSSVCGWLLDDPARQEKIDAVIFDVFTDADEEVYTALAPQIAAAAAATDAATDAAAAADERGEASEEEDNEQGADVGGVPSMPASEELAGFDEAVAALAGCDRLLIVAAAGLSISTDLPNNPYHSPDDFARHYPLLARRYGYRSAYDAMGVAGDASVPAGVRLASMARHFLNMRCDFAPTRGYAMLRALADTFAPDDTFAWTSNVDGCFVRSGFEPDRVYTTQGQMDKLQCARPGCGAVWGCLEQLRAIDAASVDGVVTDMSLAPRCPRCGSAWPSGVRPSLRGGDWFIHAPYEATQKRLMGWLDECVATRARVAIVEVGVGPNTPVVTRVPACAFASALGAAGGAPTYIRINPDPPEAPRENPARGVAFYRWRQPWAALAPLVAATVARRQDPAQRERARRQAAAAEASGNGAAEEPHAVATWQGRYRDILLSLRTPR